MKNFVTETDLKGYVPELAKFLWAGETDYSKQKAVAEQIVLGDLIDKGHILRQIQVPLLLTTEGQQDLINGMRFVCYLNSGSGDATLYGSSDNETFYEVTTLTFVDEDELSELITDTYKYYKIGLEAGLDCTCYLYETNYDLLFAYKWLELILMDVFKQEGDMFYMRASYFKGMYDDKLNKMIVATDTDEDGEADETQNNSIINITR